MSSSPQSRLAYSVRTSERDRCLKAVDDEPELEGRMPEELWEAIKGDREMIEDTIRTAVKQTKTSIRARILLS